jgi:FemAB-related protein (PEP-CTERM system-associated)
MNHEQWDNYVRKHRYSTPYHLLFFKKVIENTYHHKSRYLIAFDEQDNVKGVLPLFLINSLLFGKDIVSLPFCDYGGLLCDEDETGTKLLQEGLRITGKENYKSLELRQTNQISYISSIGESFSKFTSVQLSKVRMILKLPVTTEELFSSFPAKLRSQIRKPQKEGCTVRIGGLELISDFYDVFTYNMRDLGSPVHPRKLIELMLKTDSESNRLFVVYHDNVPVACSLVSGLNGVLVNPWASFKRSYQKIAPNMLLYWEMLTYAIDHKYQHFDFGRSTPDEGTYKFKQQWGACAEQLYWYKITESQQKSNDTDEGRSKKLFIKVWQKLPLTVTKYLGPLLRRHIHL